MFTIDLLRDLYKGKSTLLVRGSPTSVRKGDGMMAVKVQGVEGTSARVRNSRVQAESQHQRINSSRQLFVGHLPVFCTSHHSPFVQAELLGDATAGTQVRS